MSYLRSRQVVGSEIKVKAGAGGDIFDVLHCHILRKRINPSSRHGMLLTSPPLLLAEAAPNPSEEAEKDFLHSLH